MPISKIDQTGISSYSNTSLTGLITSSQIATVANTQVTGLITSGQIATVANTQITGTLTSSQIATVSNTSIQGVITTTQMATTGVTAGSYGANNQIPQIVVGTDGRVTSVANVAVSIPSGAYADANNVILQNNLRVSGNVVLANSSGFISVGPITIPTGNTVTVGANSRWVIL